MSTCKRLDLGTLGLSTGYICPTISQVNRLGLRKDRWKLETAGKLPVILEESIEYTPL